MESNDIEKIEHISKYVKYLSDNLCKSVDNINNIEKGIFKDYLFGFKDIVKELEELKFINDKKIKKIDLKSLSQFFQKISEIIDKQSISKSSNVEFTKEIIYILKDVINILENQDTIKRDRKIEQILNI